jgi:hypothetical protein
MPASAAFHRGPGDNRVPLDISSRRVMIVPRYAHG